MTQLPEQQSGDSPLTNSQSIQHETRRIGIILGDMGKVNLPALKFLVLQLNTLQHTFEYELLPTDPDDSFLKELSYQAIATLMGIEEKAPHFLRRYVKKLHQQINDYQLEETPPDLFILVTMACFSEDYYSTRLTLSHGLAILALGNWKRSMAPPSLLEFIFTGIIGESVALVSPKIVQSIHYGTKGCLFDFASSLDEVRFRVLSGFICSQCRATLQSDGLAKLADELDPTLRKDWLGKSSEPDTPAGILAKLRADLFVTSGFKPTFWENFKDTIEQEWVKNVLATVLTLLGGLLLAYLLFRLGLKQ